jgi:uncharacterized protein (TIGR02391 family)
MPLGDLLNNPVQLLALEPEELAGYLLEQLNGLDENQLHLHNFLLAQRGASEEVRRALTEAWIWLEREGLLAPKPGDVVGRWSFITRRGRRLLTNVDVETFRRAELLPRERLHPLIVEAVSAEFLRGRYDTAVFNALREVEIAVRTAGNYTAGDFGERLMRQAFQEDTGPLTDRNALVSEKQARGHLFAGAFGAFSNPARHRRVDTDPVQAVEIITLASLLMRIVDERAEANRNG